MEEHSTITRKRKKRDIEYTEAEDVIFKDIMDNILKRVPVRDLARFKCVCKSWSNSIIPKVMESISSCSKLIVSSPSEIHIQIVDHEAAAAAASSSNTKSIVKRLPFPIKEPGQIVVGSSNGFLCIFLVGKYNLILWNPLTNAYNKVNLWVENNPLVEMRFNYFYFPFIGFGYDNCNHDYKIVKLIDFKLMVYSLKTNSWRNLKPIPLSFCLNEYKLETDNPNIGTLVNGALYWFVTLYVTNARSYKTYAIFRFDLADEKQSWVQPPTNADQSIELKLTVFEVNKQLCAYQNLGRVIEMWVLKEEDNDFESRKVKWTKLMSIEHSEQVQPIIFMRNGEVLLHVKNEEKNKEGLSLYNHKQKKFKWLEIPEIKDWKYVVPTHENFL
ncbi:hypothetical protein FEM48_Zijuj07G0097700 [Ziziphus jujuba var. spinosa]|uniref:F-box domain-containing protein n=1 Tax=Ziziphus jujuba var. spinosa TaxID=714518 RepID=A0A978V3X7_ZIZJJ|nr:hypothetical protein FEM48_Zijuj07G0097700 [Ziziphus jujuba var. spinosa]